MTTTGRQIMTHAGQVAIETTAMGRQMTTDTGQVTLVLAIMIHTADRPGRLTPLGQQAEAIYGSRAKQDSDWVDKGVWFATQKAGINSSW